MSKIEDAIHDLKNDAARTRRKGYSHASAGLLELEAVLSGVERVQEFIAAKRTSAAGLRAMAASTLDFETKGFLNFNADIFDAVADGLEKALSGEG